MLDTHPLGLLERAGLRKAAQDASFDVLRDEPDRLCGSRGLGSGLKFEPHSRPNFPGQEGFKLKT